jgi:hypothetical protein
MMVRSLPLMSREMLRVSPETVCDIIAAARAMQAMADGDIDDVALDDEEETEFLAGAVKETGRDALLAELHGLTKEGSLDLIALMLVGRASTAVAIGTKPAVRRATCRSRTGCATSRTCRCSAPISSAASRRSAIPAETPWSRPAHSA